MKLSCLLLLSGVLLSFQAIAMQEEDISTAGMRVKQSNSKQEEDIKNEKNSTYTPEENKECCSHWGLSHCVAGIKEYFWRNFLCGYGFDHTRKDRAWAVYKGNHKISRTSDCLISQPYDECCYGFYANGNGCCKVNGWCDNPIYGIACAPYMAAHLLCELPYYVYHSTPNQRPGLQIEAAIPITILCCLPMCFIPYPVWYIYSGNSRYVFGPAVEEIFGASDYLDYVAYDCCLDNPRINSRTFSEGE